MKAFDLQDFLKDLENVVNIDSHAEDVEGCNKVSRYYEELLKDQYFIKEFDLGPTRGFSTLITNTEEVSYDVLLMAHVDTVFHKGTVAERPFKIVEGRGYGPGVTDMKAGGLVGVHALANCAEELKPLKIALSLNPEEEQSSVFIRPLLEELSKKSKYVIILEPARANGAHVEERKGLGRYEINFKGVAAHSGVNPADGRSAIHEMAYWVRQLITLHSLETGFTVNVGEVRGGTGANIVAEDCTIVIDIRLTQMEQEAAWNKLLEELKVHAAENEIGVKVSGYVKRPPMFKTAATDEFIALINKEAAALDMPCEWVKTGGGSDGNFSAALGIPTVDGFGPIGGNAHSDKEYMEVASIEPSYKLFLATLIALKNKLY